MKVLITRQLFDGGLQRRLIGGTKIMAAFLLLASPALEAQTSEFEFRKPSQKTVLKNVFPKAGLEFRGEFRRATGPGYEEWEKDVAGNVGIIRKFVREELVHPIWMNEERLSANLERYAKEHPDELFLLHFNSRAKRHDFHADRFWIGHYLQKQGVHSTSAISESQTVIEVPKTVRFEIQKPFRGQAPSEEDSLLLLVERKADGSFHWENYELVYLTKIGGGKLVVKRGAHGTQPRSFEKGRCYLTQIKLYRNRLVLNFSLDCPRDPNGKQAADVLLDLFQEWFRKGGSLVPMDGIAFDVQYGEISPGFDTNLDGVADGGMIAGEPRWAQGLYQFSKAIRERFGDEFIITTDGHRRENSQAVGLHNGIESEGLVQHNDGWRGISRTVNIHQYWNKFNTARPQFSYIASKLTNPEDARHQLRLRRFAHAMAACLGVGCTGDLDEATMGVERKHFWLGEPLSPMVNLGEKSGTIVYQMPEVLSEDEIERWSEDSNAAIERLAQGGVRISKKDQTDEAKSGHETRVSRRTLTPSLSFGRSFALPPGDVLITFEARSKSARHGFEGTDVPRLISLEMSGHHLDQRVGKAGLDIWSLVGSRDFFKSEFYVRNAGGETGRSGVKIGLEIEGKGDLEVRNFTIRSAPAAYLREFENGVVLVNPGLDPFIFDLEKQFGSHGFRRLKASVGLESADPKLNTGELVSDPKSFVVAPVAAQFLIKENSSLPAE